MEVIIIPLATFLLATIIILCCGKNINLEKLKNSAWIGYLIAVFVTLVSGMIYAGIAKSSAVIKEEKKPVIKIDEEKHRYYYGEGEYDYAYIVDSDDIIESPDSTTYLVVKYALNDKTSKFFLDIDSVVLGNKLYIKAP